jgi:hypothetical protein
MERVTFHVDRHMYILLGVFVLQCNSRVEADQWVMLGSQQCMRPPTVTRKFLERFSNYHQCRTLG